MPRSLYVEDTRELRERENNQIVTAPMVKEN